MEVEGNERGWSRAEQCREEEGNDMTGRKGGDRGDWRVERRVGKVGVREGWGKWGPERMRMRGGRGERSSVQTGGLWEGQWRGGGSEVMGRVEDGKGRMCEGY